MEPTVCPQAARSGPTKQGVTGMGNLAYPGFLAVFTLAGLVVAYFVLGEAFSLIRDVFQHARSGDSPKERPHRRQNKHDTGPLNPDRVIPPFEDRQTVERLITYFEDEEDEVTTKPG